MGFRLRNTLRTLPGIDKWCSPYPAGQRGDTLVEVIMAVVVLGMVIIGTITIMNHSLSAIQVASEHTEVRLRVNSQAELLRRLRDGYQQSPDGQLGQEWLRLFAATPGYATTALSSNGGDCQVTPGKQPFYVQQQAGALQLVDFDPGLQPPTSSVPGQGLWAEATRSPAGITPGYVDFQLRACWDAAGSLAGRQQILTVVRLYDPAH